MPITNDRYLFEKYIYRTIDGWAHMSYDPLPVSGLQCVKYSNFTFKTLPMLMMIFENVSHYWSSVTGECPSLFYNEETYCHKVNGLL